nr:uncharacterized protein LOC120963320 [Aegilops tauschii subsp. strangulata]
MHTEEGGANPGAGGSVAAPNLGGEGPTPSEPGTNPSLADPEDIDTVIEEVAKDAAAEADKIIAEEAAKGATEDAAKGPTGETGKAAIEEASKGPAREAGTASTGAPTKGEVFDDEVLAAAGLEAQEAAKQQAAQDEAARHQHQAALNSQEEDIAAREGKLAATLRGKDGEVEKLVMQRTQELEQRHEEVLNAQPLVHAGKVKELEVERDELKDQALKLAKEKDTLNGALVEAQGALTFVQFFASQISTEMYSMPNGEHVHEGEESGGDSGEWNSDGGGDEENEDSRSGEEVDSPPRSERRSKKKQDLASVRGKVVTQSAHTSKRPRTSSPIPTEKAPKQLKVAPSKPRKALPKIKVDVPVASGAATSGNSMCKDGDDEEMECAATSQEASHNVIELPDDDEDEPQKPMGRRNGTSGRRVPASKMPQSTPATESAIQQSRDLNRASLTFVIPLSSEHPSASTAHGLVSSVQLHALESQAAAADPLSPLFTAHHVPEDQVSASKEAIRQAGLMMEQMKVVCEASQASYDANSALQANVQRSCELGARFADLEQKQVQLNLDLELTKENLLKPKDDVAEKMRQALEKKDLDLPAAQKTAEEKTSLADQKLASVEKLEEENTKLRTALDEANKEVTRLKNDKGTLTDKVEDLTRKRDELEVYLGGLAKKLFLMLEDEAAMNVLQLESHLASVMDYLARLKVAVSWIDMEGKKSSARCGADVALSLVRVHCKEAKEEKLAAIKVANTKKLDFASFMETFIAAATRIADGIDLDEFEEKVARDLHLVVLADRDGAYVVFVA